LKNATKTLKLTVLVKILLSNLTLKSIPNGTHFNKFGKKINVGEYLKMCLSFFSDSLFVGFVRLCVRLLIVIRETQKFVVMVILFYFAENSSLKPFVKIYIALRPLSSAGLLVSHANIRLFVRVLPRTNTGAFRPVKKKNV
jgi:hypothetical protein